MTLFALPRSLRLAADAIGKAADKPNLTTQETRELVALSALMRAIANGGRGTLQAYVPEVMGEQLDPAYAGDPDGGLCR